MSASTSRKRKNQPVEKPRPSVFDRLGTKASQSQQQSDARTNFCHHWRNTGNCPFGSSCKNANFHTLISPSKRSKGGDKEQLSKEQLNRKDSGRGKKGKGKETWTELNEAELERRKLQLQKELDLQNRQEMKKKSTKKQKRSSSSSSSSSTQSSTNTSKNSSVKSNQLKPRRPANRKRKGKGAVGSIPPKSVKESEPKRMRENPRDNKKRSGSNIRPEQRSRSKHGASGPGSASKKRKNSTSSENSSMERRRQQNKTSSHPSKGKGRSPSPDKKKKPSSSSAYDKKSPPRRRDSPVGRRNSPGRSSNRKRSASPGPPRSRRRTPSPRNKIEKKHDLRHDSPPVIRHRSPSPEKKESRRAQTPPSPHDRGHPRGGRNPRRDSPEPRGLPRDSRSRPQGARSPDRRNRAPSREPRESGGDKRDFARREYNSPAPSRSHVAARISPELSVRPSSRDRREESSRDKGRPLKESERDRRREGGQEKSRDRGRGHDEELPSLMNLMTQHPAQYSPRRGRDEPQEHRSSTRERGRYERYDERGEPFAPPVEEHQRSKRTTRRDSPSRPRPQKAGRDWPDHPERKDKDWDRRGKAGGSSSHRDWDDQTRQRPSAKGGHRRGPSPTNASPKINRDIECERGADEVKLDEKVDEKKVDKIPDDELCEPPSKKICLDLDDSNLKTIDHVESDFSDFSDDADDILNADVMEDEHANDAEDSAGGDLDKDDEEPVEDMLEDMDFEEISDGELDAEDIKAGADALSVDWAALLNQTKHTKREESDSVVNKWDIGPALSRIGVPLSLKGSFDLQSIGLHPPDKETKVKIEDGKIRCGFLFDDYSKLQDEVPGVHAAIIRKKETIASILNPIYHRGIDCAYGEQLRKICPFKEPDVEKAEQTPWNNNLHQLALDLLKGSCGLKEVQQRLGIETINGVKVEP